MTDEDRISIVGIATGEERSGLRWRRNEAEFSRDEVRVGELRKRVDEFVRVLTEVLATTPMKAGGYHVREVTVNAEISAKGTVSILGCGGEIGGSGGLTFTFVRDDVSTSAD
ncbi:hypothetical protein HRW18_18520 [Streptomyces lunaelactis]|uniref:Pepco domain-containing protein n=1 Tax=Streptomyces lunaelactis TaxID=1535768 RepID=UPI001585B0E9|nr:hypothetical protein [Streptomyces lunaelactis]NUK09960.1 hypothetical protein [Streptomyces lunaelactis]NUK72730.1 hypothetical protein [Streptomyces lunaelactis]NUL11424.1 hypothetical protein [Streptomyces lunaelactis]NUL25349.1 hypothetical protein [Streptomyces lunaelactis]